jgi:hypothetical protein
VLTGAFVSLSMLAIGLLSSAALGQGDEQITVAAESAHHNPFEHGG